jgi:hypothetical protein
MESKHSNGIMQQDSIEEEKSTYNEELIVGEDIQN